LLHIVYTPAGLPVSHGMADEVYYSSLF